MIHIATVHWQTDRWIDIQLKYINKHIEENLKVYAFLSGNAIKHKNKFFYACTEPIKSHAIKLNLLAEIIALSSNRDDDIIIFLDGDAFPIGNITKLIKEKIPQHKLLAIQRIENCGDIQPHPSFCATTIAFWKQIHGDWKAGFKWKDSNNDFVTDTGGNLLEILNKNNINWFPLHQTSHLSNYPLLFGIYNNLIYHHGSGFRDLPGKAVLTSMGLPKIQKKPFSILLDKIPDDLIWKIKCYIHPKKRYLKKIQKILKPIENKIYSQIRYDNIFDI